MAARDVGEKTAEAHPENASPFQRPSGEEARERLLAGLPVTDRRLEVAGVSTAVLEGGDGPPLVLLPAPGEFAALWIRVIPDLVTTHHVIAPDLPGSGASELSDGPPDVGTVLRWLGELIDQTCATPPVLVGHAAGGALAARFAVDHSDRIGQLVLVDSYGLARFRPAPRMAISFIRVTLRPTERSLDRAFRHCFVDLNGVRAEMGERWEWLAAYALDRFRAPSVKAAGRSLGPKLVAAIPPEDLARITAPTALIWGRHDQGVRLAVAEAASARCGWGLHVIENAADDPAMERPEAFLQALRATHGSSSSWRQQKSSTRERSRTGQTRPWA
jgi:pimeloyl-ACP methyl ester carboxylesterase